MTTFEELRTLRRQRPFVPFTIVLRDGRRFMMVRPLQFAFDETRVVLYDDRDLTEFFPTSAVARIEHLHPVG